MGIGVGLMLGCSASVEPIESERAGLAPCSEFGHVVAGAAIGDSFEACDAAIQSVVISNGEVSGVVTGDCWRLDVVRLTGGAPLVVQFRDWEHRTLCVPLTP
jgi:hypothetical protein